MRFAFPPYGNLCCKSCFDIMPAGGKIRIPGRQGPDAMRVIGQNDDGLDGKWSALTGRLEHSPKIVNVFGQVFPAAFQQCNRKKERASWNKGAAICLIAAGYPRGRAAQPRNSLLADR